MSLQSQIQQIQNGNLGKMEIVEKWKFRKMEIRKMENGNWENEKMEIVLKENARLII